MVAQQRALVLAAAQRALESGQLQDRLVAIVVHLADRLFSHGLVNGLVVLQLHDVFAQFVVGEVFLVVLQFVLENVNATEQMVFVDHRLPDVGRILARLIDDLLQAEQLGFERLLALHGLLDERVQLVQLCRRQAASGRLRVAEFREAVVAIVSVGPFDLFRLGVARAELEHGDDAAVLLRERVFQYVDAKLDNVAGFHFVRFGRRGC